MKEIINVSGFFLLWWIILILGSILTSCSIPKGLIDHSDVIDEEAYYKRYGNTYLQAVPVKIGDEFFAIPLPPGVHVDPRKIEVK